MKLMLHGPNGVCDLPQSYRRAFQSATELLIVSAYLTNWDDTVALSPSCMRFRMIVGKDFGITRKIACERVLSWLPAQYKVHFRVADGIEGFHPKAVFWREHDNKFYAIIGSSNLSLAAFGKNYEANIETEIGAEEFDSARDWVDSIAELSTPISKDWLGKYQEATPKTRRKKASGKADPKSSVSPIELPRPAGSAAKVRQRRTTVAQYRKNRAGLIHLIRECASGSISKSEFYKQLPKHWGGDVGGRLQGNGWERSGKSSDFRSLCQSLVNILDATSSRRDDTVVTEIDKLTFEKNHARGAFLSEMLCLEYPERYPVLDRPVFSFLKEIQFRGTSGMSEGAKYLDLAQRLRLALKQNPAHPAKSLAELDIVIWLADRKPQTSSRH